MFLLSVDSNNIWTESERIIKILNDANVRNVISKTGSLLGCCSLIVLSALRAALADLIRKGTEAETLMYRERVYPRTKGVIQALVPAPAL